MSRERIMTIGHSTHAAEAFLGLLRAHGVTGVADVRTIPRSRRHPQFSRDSLAAMLSAEGIAYEHFPGLGGLRTPRPDSPNGGWQHRAFRGYADHMDSDGFRGSLEALLTFAHRAVVAVMCAESRWWQCHRRLIADALVARGVEVRHIMSDAGAPVHELTAFARVSGSEVSYPALV